jgi:hypothetical protein
MCFSLVSNVPLSIVTKPNIAIDNIYLSFEKLFVDENDESSEQTTCRIEGILTILNWKPIAVSISIVDVNQIWTIEVKPECQLPGLKDIAALTGGTDIENILKQFNFENSVLKIQNFSIGFIPADKKIKIVSLSIGQPGWWKIIEDVFEVKINEIYFTVINNVDWQIEGSFDANINLGGAEIGIFGSYPSMNIMGSLNREKPAHLYSVLDHFGMPIDALPREMEKLTISQLDFFACGKPENIRLEASIRIEDLIRIESIVIPGIDISIDYLSIQIGYNQSTSAKFSAAVEGSISIGRSESVSTVEIDNTFVNNRMSLAIGFELEKKATFKAIAKNIRLSEITERLLGIELPDNKLNLVIEELNFMLDSEKNLEISGEVQLKQGLSIEQFIDVFEEGEGLWNLLCEKKVVEVLDSGRIKVIASEEETRSILKQATYAEDQLQDIITFLCPSLTFGDSDLSVGILKFEFKHKKNESSDTYSTLASIAVSGQPNIGLSKDFVCEEFNLAFDFNSKEKSWKLGGDIDVLLFEKEKLKFSASIEKTSDKSRFELAAILLPESILQENFGGREISGVAGNTLWDELVNAGYIEKKPRSTRYRFSSKFKPYDKDFELEIFDNKKTLQRDILTAITVPSSLLEIPDVVSGGKLADIGVRCIQLYIEKYKDKEKGFQWNFSAVGDLKVYNLLETDDQNELIHIEAGRLDFLGSKTTTELTFSSPNTAVHLPGITYGAPEAIVPTIGIEEVSIKRNDNDWAFDAKTYLTVSNMPPIIDTLFSERMGGGLIVDKNGIELKLSNIFKLQEVDLKEITGESGFFDLAPFYFKLDDFALKVGKEIACSGILYVGLPSNLNDLFKVDPAKEPLQVFRTFNKSDYDNGNFDSLCALQLDISITNGVSLHLENSPISDIGNDTFYAKYTKPKGDEGCSFIDIKMGDYGRVEFTIPALKYDAKTSAFAVSGGYKIVEELRLPLTPLKLLLSQFPEMKEVAEKLDLSIPIKGIDIITQEDVGGDMKRTLIVESLFKLFEESTGISMPNELKIIFDRINNQLDNLPTALVDYFSFKIPEEMDFDLKVDATGGVSFTFHSGNSENRGTPLRLLLPTFPTLTGIELYSIEFGTLFGGSLLKLKIDAVFDSFDMFTLAGCLLLPFDLLDDMEGLKDFIPSKNELQHLQNRFELEDVLIFIIYETGIPIPIPLFYKNISYQYNGIEGIEGRVSISFPEPVFSADGLIKLIQQLVAFFTDKDALLESSKLPESMDISFDLGPTYIELPKYLDKFVIGLKDGLDKLSLLEFVTVILNTIKTGSINYLIKSTDIKYRIYSGQYQILGLLDVEAQFAITTPDEFADKAYPKLNFEENDSVADIMALLPTSTGLDIYEEDNSDKDYPAGIGDNNQGLVVFANGRLELFENIGFQVTLGMVASSMSGFGMGLRLKGRIAGLVDMHLQGIIELQPQNKDEVFRLIGDSKLDIAGHETASGNFKISNKEFYVDGMVDLFPPNCGVRLYGHMEGHINSDHLYLLGEFDFQIHTLQLSSETWIRMGRFADFNNGNPVNSIYFNITLLQSSFQFYGCLSDGDLNFSAVSDPVNLCNGLFTLTQSIENTNNGPNASILISHNELQDFKLQGALTFLSRFRTTADIEYKPDGFHFDVKSSIFVERQIYTCMKLECKAVPQVGFTATGAFEILIDIGGIVKAIGDLIVKPYNDIVKNIPLVPGISIPYISLVFGFNTVVNISMYDPKDISNHHLEENKKQERERVIDIKKTS